LESTENPQPAEGSARKGKWVPIVIALFLFITASVCILIAVAINFFLTNKVLSNSGIFPIATETALPTATPLPNPQLRPGNILDRYPFDTSQTWPTYTDNNEMLKLERAVKDGKYLWVVSAKKGFYYVAVPTQKITLPEDYYQISVDVRLVDGPPDATYGLVFGIGEGDNYWVWEIAENGVGILIQKKNGKWMDLTAKTSSMPVNRKGKNTLTVKVSKETVYFYVNGWEAGSYTQPEPGSENFFESNSVGLCIELRTPGDKATYEFDNLIISRPETFEEEQVLPPDGTPFKIERESTNH
jgi:hypothetical protein